MMIKKILSCVLAVLLLCSALSLSAAADEAEPAGVTSSDYFMYYSASLSQGTSSGRLKLTYTLQATGTMTQLGVYKIIVRNPNGSIYTTIFGNTSNGLMKNNSAYHNGSYYFNAISGNTYYCTVTFYAKDASGSQTKSIVTASVTCP